MQPPEAGDERETGMSICGDGSVGELHPCPRCGEVCACSIENPDDDCTHRCTPPVNHIEDQLVEAAALLVRLTDLDSCKNSARRDAIAWLGQVGHKVLMHRVADVVRALTKEEP